MSENYTKADLRHIAKWLIEDLRECEDGTSFTTRQLAENYRDILTSIKFHVGGFFGRTTEITIKKDEDGALVPTTLFFIAKAEWSLRAVADVFCIF